MRSRRIARFASFALAAMVVVGQSSVAAAQGQDRDLAEINAYRLSEAKLAKFAQASKNLAAAVEANPSLTKTDMKNDNPTLSEMAAFYDSHPPIKRAINAAGMTSREYVIFMLSMMQAGMMSWAAKQPGATMPPDFPKENVAFYDSHKAQIEAVTKELETMSKRSDEESEDAEDAEEDPPAR